MNRASSHIWDHEFRQFAHNEYAFSVMAASFDTEGRHSSQIVPFIRSHSIKCTNSIMCADSIMFAFLKVGLARSSESEQCILASFSY